MRSFKMIVLILSIFLADQDLPAQQNQVSVIGEGWAATSVNTVVFRKNAIVSFKNWQFAAYYDAGSRVVLAKRQLGSSSWTIKQTTLTGNTRDAHNSISIITDGEGYLHLSWDQHASALNYCKSKEPLSLEMDLGQSMTGLNETKVTYPEFYLLNTGDLLFLYRDGSSGRGNLVVNKYSLQLKKWEQVQNNLVDGEGRRNAYWQACTDSKGSFHLSWVWRESADVASNHDICYARTDDGGQTWVRSDGSSYTLPINASNAEYITRIPQNSDLINQVSMSADEEGRPFIATYWRNEGSVPQYQLVYYKKGKWLIQEVSSRKTSFSLSGAGTKRIPVARPQLLINGKKVFYFFRDEERGNRASVFISKDRDKNKWTVKDITEESLGQWEPLLDSELWRTKKEIHLFLQYSGQGDGEKLTETKPQPVKVIEWNYR